MNKPRDFSVIENSFITLADGRRLAVRMWMPERDSDGEGDGEETLPAVLEYLPYRKRDGTNPRDESTYPSFAAAGYVGVRVDISGTGDSDGSFDDEYSPQELSDGVEVINWISEQSWSNGNVGIMGISWGGFNGLQLASMHPEPLKAVISIGTTVDRYNDDIHYKNGCQLYSNFSWSNTMLLYNARPADPLHRNDWLENWKLRLETQPLPIEDWLQHQTRDAYWEHGSIKEDYENYTIPTLIIGGWADHYHNAPPALAANAKGVCKAVNGPWIHKYPHFAWPKPRMDFLGEAINWWDHWLSGKSNGSDNLPDYRAFISENVKPGGRREHEDGHWVSASTWPLDTETQTFFLQADGTLKNEAGPSDNIEVCSPQDCGITCGEIFSLAPDADLPADQRLDNATSACFTTDPLDKAVEILGRPSFNCPISIDQTNGNLCIRLIDVHPDGTSQRVSWGVINLAHRNGNAAPSLLTPGQTEEITIILNECGYKFLPGHKIQIAVSTSYWPAILPPPVITTATLELGSSASLTLPLTTGTANYEMVEPIDPSPLPEYKNHKPAKRERWVEKDFQNNQTHYHVIDDTGEDEIPGHGLRVRQKRDECWTITPDNPLSSKATGTHTWWTSRGDWEIRIESDTSMSCDADYFYIDATVRAWHAEELISERTWDNKIKRNFM